MIAYNAGQTPLQNAKRVVPRAGTSLYTAMWTKHFLCGIIRAYVSIVTVVTIVGAVSILSHAISFEKEVEKDAPKCYAALQ